MVNESLRLKNGTHISAHDMMSAIINARQINPDIKRIYCEVERSGKLNFVIRKHDKNGNVSAINIHSVNVNLDIIEERCDIKPEEINVYNGYPYCVSVKKYEKSLKDPRNHLGGVVIGYTDNDDLSLSCPVNK